MPGPRPIAIAHLPKSVQNIPHVRGLSLPVYPAGESRFYVLGRRQTYIVSIINGLYHCDCLAAKSGHNCAHIYAAKRY